MFLNNFFKKQGMELFKVENVDTHGGSIRVFIQSKNGNHSIDRSIIEFINRERMFGLDKLDCYKEFGEKVKRIGGEAKDFVQKAKNEGKKIIGYGSPAKATTLLNFLNIDKNHIDLIVEDNPLKHGKILPGVRIPIKSRESLKDMNPDYVIILAWNFAEEILRNNEEIQRNGAKFVVLNPKLKIF